MQDKKEQLRVILGAVAEAFSGFKRAFRRGTESDELFLPFTGVLDRRLGEYGFKYDYLFGRDTRRVDGVSRGYVPADRDTVIMDISVGKNGVWCDVCRTFFIGGYTPEQEKKYEMIKASIKCGERVLRAGNAARDVYLAVNSVYGRSGKKLIHHAGHRIGDSPLVQPQFLEDNAAVMESGFYTIESGDYGESGIRLENDYFVSDGEPENLFEDLMSLDIKEYVLNEK